MRIAIQPSGALFHTRGHARLRLPGRAISFTAHPKPRATIAHRRPLSLLNRILPPPTSKSGTPTSTSLKSLLSLTIPERRPLAIGTGFLVISSCVSLSIPFTIGRLIDYFSTETPRLLVSLPTPLVNLLSLPSSIELSLTTAAVSLFTLLTVGALANAGRNVLYRMSGQRIVARLRQKTYESALRQEVEFVEKGEGDIVSRLSVDSTIVGEAVTANVSDGLRAIITASAGLGAMLYLSPQLTALMLALVPPVSLGAVVYGRYLKRLTNKTQEAIGEMTKTASESLNSLRTVQAYTAFPYEANKFSERMSDILQLAKKEAYATGTFYGATGWSGNLTMLCLLGYGGSLVSKGLISVGDLTSLLLYSVYVGGGLQTLTSFFSSIMRAVGASDRIFSLISRHPEIGPVANAIELSASRRGPLKFENVSFQYPSRKDVEILKDFNLEVSVGESVAIVGSSGSGKSSAHALLLRFYDPVTGRITYDGEDIKNFSPDSWRKIIGVVPQDPILFTGTIASNIAYGNDKATMEEIEAAARLANCDFIYDFPMGFDTKIGRMSLSGGQRQRLAIARALLKKPAILALDEATSALDAGSEMRVNDAIDNILSDSSTTCIIVAHRLSTIARAERIVVLDDGRIVESGTYRNLTSDKNSRFRQLMAAQLDTASRTSNRIEYQSSS